MWFPFTWLRVAVHTEATEPKVHGGEVVCVCFVCLCSVYGIYGCSILDCHYCFFSNIYFWYLIFATLHCSVILLLWHPLIMTLQYSDIPFFPLPTLHVQTLFHCVHSAFFFSFHYFLSQLKRDQTFALCSNYQANWTCIV